MDWKAFFDIVGRLDWAAIAQVVATVVLVITLIVTERRASRDSKRADAAADRAENAARGTIDALDKISRSIDEINLTGGLQASAGRRGVAWELVHHGGDTYRLTNVGTSRAEDVRISAHPTLHLVEGATQGGSDLGPTEALTFMASRSLGTRDSTITVTWASPNDGEEHQWRYPLPSRPPRN